MGGNPVPPGFALIRAARGVLASVMTAPLLAIILALHTEAYIGRFMMRLPWIYRIALRPRNAELTTAEKVPQRQCP